ncbi:hypothetical protein P9112_001081 [Eukaryota sp. TZLM1-RC]
MTSIHISAYSPSLHHNVAANYGPQPVITANTPFSSSFNHPIQPNKPVVIITISLFFFMFLLFLISGGFYSSFGVMPFVVVVVMFSIPICGMLSGTRQHSLDPNETTSLFADVPQPNVPTAVPEVPRSYAYNDHMYQNDPSAPPIYQVPV